MSATPTTPFEVTKNSERNSVTLQVKPGVTSDDIANWCAVVEEAERNPELYYIPDDIEFSGIEPL